jgi:hypothetical protein
LRHGRDRGDGHEPRQGRAGKGAGKSDHISVSHRFCKPDYASHTPIA